MIERKTVSDEHWVSADNSVEEFWDLVVGKNGKSGPDPSRQELLMLALISAVKSVAEAIYNRADIDEGESQ